MGPNLNEVGSFLDSSGFKRRFEDAKAEPEKFHYAEVQPFSGANQSYLLLSQDQVRTRCTNADDSNGEKGNGNQG